MDAYECVATKLDVRDYSKKDVPAEVKLKVLEAGRLTGSGINTQHWRFVLVQSRDGINRLADDSTSGNWIEHCNFAVIVLTDPRHDFHSIDAGRAAQDMQLAAWNYGVASCIFTGTREAAMRRDFNIPEALHPGIVIGFGYPTKKLSGKKNRKPLSEIVYTEKY